MLIIETSRGTTHSAEWMHEDRSRKFLLIEVIDDRPIPAIAADFDGLESVTATMPEREPQTYAGYSVLTTISKEDRDGTALLTLYRKEDA